MLILMFSSTHTANHPQTLQGGSIVKCISISILNMNLEKP